MSFTLENFDLSNLLGSDLDAFTQSAANLKNPHNNLDVDSYHDFLSPLKGGESIDSDLPYSWFDYNRNHPQIKTEPMDDIVPVEALPPSMFFQPPESQADAHKEAKSQPAQGDANAESSESSPQVHSDTHQSLDDMASDDESDVTVKPTPKRASRKSSAFTKAKNKALSPQIKRKRSVSPSTSTSSRRSSVMDADIDNIELPKIQKTAHSSQFVPPDTSNLPKREARLLKNRAAAFLSRQRKREAFEHLEDKVNELEREKATLAHERDTAIAGERRALEELHALQAQMGDGMQQ
ncbi:hypothetical protein E3P99_03745 [Wallemia hederae]|uniref:BZIP domain-containing protein n=1 Tax=Wallemia hederae TaxID=1540922 RepID=A0A4T0FE80_9BASI|nr:hypothetical protein E3P99_03745 [Wallemia hederae]